MRRNNRRILSEDEQTKKMLYISGVILIMAILAFIVTFVIYSNVIKSKDNFTEAKKITDLEQASSSIGKSVNEMIIENNSENEINNVVSIDDTKIAINTSNIINDDSKNNFEKQEVEPSFEKPVEGEILKTFAKDTLIYSETLKEWVTHTGIDIKSNKTTVVKAAEEGTIKSIKNDPRYGITVVIEHSKGYQSVYSNLLTAEFVKEGEKVKKLQTIGTVGNTAMFEIADDYHLHFEILKDGEYIDPNLYIK